MKQSVKNQTFKERIVAALGQSVLSMLSMYQMGLSPLETDLFLSQGSWSADDRLGLAQFLANANGEQEDTVT
jgi:hypothetical protein